MWRRSSDCHLCLRSVFTSVTTSGETESKKKRKTLKIWSIALHLRFGSCAGLLYVHSTLLFSCHRHINTEEFCENALFVGMSHTAQSKEWFSNLLQPFRVCTSRVWRAIQPFSRWKLYCVWKGHQHHSSRTRPKKVAENFDFADGFMRARAGFKVEQTFVTVFNGDPKLFINEIADDSGNLAASNMRRNHKKKFLKLFR